jgi:Mn2+/Fe2+ NRAMP family transporter
MLIVCNDSAAMGERTNGRLLNVVGWVTTITMGVAAVGLILTTIFG